MAKPPYITDKQREHMLKATRGYSKFKERDCALLIVLYGTALALTELAQLKVSDYITAAGKVSRESELRAEISTSGEARGLWWVGNTVAAMDEYLAWRLQQRHGATTLKGAYRGLDPESAIFLTDDGQPYSLTSRVLKASGLLSYSCNTLGALIARLHSDCGIEGGSAQSARRTFVVNAHKQGFDLVHIAHIVGHKSISSTKRMALQDPVDLGGIVARVSASVL
jgi:site-specific recombinase XerD